MSSEVKRYDPINSDGTCGTCVEDPDYGAYVEFADYATLEAECERLRGTMMEVVTKNFAKNLGRAAKDKELDYYLSEGVRQLQAERDALAAELAGIKRQEPVAVVDENDDAMWADILPDRTVKCGQMLYALHPATPAVDIGRNAAFEACPDTGCDWSSFYRGWNAALAAFYASQQEVRK